MSSDDNNVVYFLQYNHVIYLTFCHFKLLCLEIILIIFTNIQYFIFYNIRNKLKKQFKYF